MICAADAAGNIKMKKGTTLTGGETVKKYEIAKKKTLTPEMVMWSARRKPPAICSDEKRNNSDRRRNSEEVRNREEKGADP